MDPKEVDVGPAVSRWRGFDCCERSKGEEIDAEEVGALKEVGAPTHKAKIPLTNGWKVGPTELPAWSEHTLRRELQCMNDKLDRMQSMDEKLDRILEQTSQRGAHGNRRSIFPELVMARSSGMHRTGSVRRTLRRSRSGGRHTVVDDQAELTVLEDVLAPSRTRLSEAQKRLRSSIVATSAEASAQRASLQSLGTCATKNTEDHIVKRQSTLKTLEEKDLERATKVLKQNFCMRRTATQVAWEFLEVPESSLSAWLFATLTPLFILAAVFMTLMQSLEHSPLYGVSAAVLETAIDCVFLLECVARLICCPHRTVFFLSLYNIIDVLAAAPLAVRIANGFVMPTGNVVSVSHAILLCIVPVVRLLKSLRRFEKFHLLLNAFKLAAEALPVILLILSIIALTFAMLIYLVEPRDNVQSIPMSLWLTIVTMSTVGYGDMTPKSTIGRLITGLLITLTALYMAIPIGIVGHAFSVTWEKRDKILLMERTRDRLRQRGFSAADIPALFRMAAHGPFGTLDITDFRKLLRNMQIGFSEERILDLFQSFDTDQNGTVDDREFVRHLFPNSFRAIYDELDAAAEEDDEDSDDVEVEDHPHPSAQDATNGSALDNSHLSDEEKINGSAFEEDMPEIPMEAHAEKKH